ncbi:MAG: YqgE/AlgH family protein [Pseudomonadota bacterium]
MTHDTHGTHDLSDGFTGQLLVALPHLEDTPFEEAVCLICTHDDEHAFGVIVNKPLDGAKLAEIVKGMGIPSDEAAEETPVYFGGPVGMERGAVLHSLDYRTDETVQITPDVGLTATREALEAICDRTKAPNKAMLIMGHSGWSGGQLENEMKRNDWLSIDAKSEIIFGDKTEAWSDSLSHLGINDLGQFRGNERPVPQPN